MRSTVTAYRDTLDADRAALSRGRRRRAGRRARAAPRWPRPSPRRWRSTAAAPSSSTRSPCWWARSRPTSRSPARRVDDGAAGDSRRRAEHGAHAPARRLRGAAHDARGAGARRRREGGVVPGRLAHRRRRLRLVRDRRPLQVVGARVGHRRAAVAADLRRRAARGGRAERARASCDAARRPAIASRSSSRSRTSRTSSRRCGCWPSRPRRRRARSLRPARTTALSDARYRNGFVSQLDLLDAQRSELRNRRQALQVRCGAVPGDRGAGARAGRRLGLKS